MKKLFYSAFAVLIAAACTVSEPVEQPADVSMHEMVFHAVCGEENPASRTVRQEDGKVFWAPNEEISVFQGYMYDGGAKFVSNNTFESPTAEFFGTLPSGSGYYWAVYPFCSDAWCYYGEYVVTGFTNIQTAVPGSFANDLYVAVARSENTDLWFSHPLGGVKFSVVNSGIKKVVMKANGGETIATNLIAVDMNSDGKAIVEDYDEPYDFIELTPEGGGTFIPGQDYYFVTLPVYMQKGFTLIFERQDGTILRRNVDKTVEIKRATFRTLPNADSVGSFITPTITFSPGSVSLDARGGSFAINVNYYGTPHIAVAGSDWITEAGTIGDPRFGSIYNFKVQPNTGAARSGMITVCDDSNCYFFTVNQSGASDMAAITHHSLGMRFTATWCGYCPRMNIAFAQAKADLGDKFNIVNFHATSSDLPFAGTPSLMNLYQVSGYPTGIIDGRALIRNYSSSYTTSLVKAAVQETEESLPVNTSAGISSSLSGRTVNVGVDVFAIKAGAYKISVFLLESGIVCPQQDYDEYTVHEDYVHNNIARMALTAYRGDNFSVASDNGTVHFDYSATIPDSYDIGNMSILVYIQQPFGTQGRLQSGDYGDWYIDNSRIAAIGVSLAPEVE